MCEGRFEIGLDFGQIEWGQECISHQREGMDLPRLVNES